MRVLLLFRGAPGAGKSTYINEHKLQPYTLCADDIRNQMSALSLDLEGNLTISPKNENSVWKLLFQLLEKRMKNGDFTVVDSTNSKTSDMQKFVKLAKEYRYRIYMIDLTEIHKEICKERNLLRPNYKQVPENVIDKMYARFNNQNVPKAITVLKPDELNKIMYSKMDLSEYKKIHVVGDIHACNTALNEYLKDGIKEDEFYIFLGDYTDRGIENIETLQYLLSIYRNKNVVLLEGNHERYVRGWSNNQYDFSRAFEKYTLPILNKAVEDGKISKKDIKEMYMRLGQIAYFTYNGKEVFCCHGGINTLTVNPVFISTEQLIRGVGKYEDYSAVAESFLKNTEDNQYLINGHRNVQNLPVQVNERCFNLEGKVEFGGHLRVITLDKDGFKCHEIKNDVYKLPDDTDEIKCAKEVLKLSDDDIPMAVHLLRNNPNIKETKQGDISSFNFTRNAFNKGIWDHQTVKSRGLFINTKENKIITRGYEKFFNDSQIEQVYGKPMLDYLKDNLKFPVNVYVKENGFLGMIAYNPNEDKLIFCTKSLTDSWANDGDMVSLFKKTYYELTTYEQRQRLLNYLREYYNKNEDKTILCECVDNQKDPHIIKYDSRVIYLLDIVDNTLEFNNIKNNVILATAAFSFGLKCKQLAKTIYNYDEFVTWHNEVTQKFYKYNGKYIEGFVIQDSNNFMMKIKLDYYLYHIRLRGFASKVLKYGEIKESRLGELVDETYELLYKFLLDHRMEYVTINKNGDYSINDNYNFLEMIDGFEDWKRKQL